MTIELYAHKLYKINAVSDKGRSWAIIVQVGVYLAILSIFYRAPRNAYYNV